MRILGVDITSTPGPKKPLAACAATFVEGQRGAGLLQIDSIDALPCWAALTAAIDNAGPDAVIGLDCPLGQAREFVRAIGWPTEWPALIAHVRAMSADGFVNALRAFCAGRPEGRKFIRRRTDSLAGAAAANNFVRPPVARMFHQAAAHLDFTRFDALAHQRNSGAPRLVEVYPKLAAQAAAPPTDRAPPLPYKDGRATQLAARRAARGRILDWLLTDVSAEGPADIYGFRIVLTPRQRKACLHDDQGDLLDSVLAAVQAAWAGARLNNGWGPPTGIDPLEGWIADPSLLTRRCS